MKKVNVSARVTAKSKAGEKAGLTEDISTAAVFNFPETVSEAVDMWGEDIVLNKIEQSVAIDAQSMLRRKLVAGQTEEQIKAAAEEWKPSMGPVKKSAVEKATDLISKLTSEEDLDKILETIQKLKKQK